ncbi:MAG: hypothetical protein ACO38O_02605, partial [Ilumatobacteraceae bacterium]
TDLRYELERERQITLAHFDRIDQRFLDLTASFNARFELVDKRFEQVDKRFDQMERRFDLLDERLRFNKTLVVASLSALASTASVILTLLK